jgi:hypothetical protein
MDTVTIVDYFPNPSRAQHNMKEGKNPIVGGACL